MNLLQFTYQLWIILNGVARGWHDPRSWVAPDKLSTRRSIYSNAYQWLSFVMSSWCSSWDVSVCIIIHVQEKTRLPFVRIPCWNHARMWCALVYCVICCIWIQVDSRCLSHLLWHAYSSNHYEFSMILTRWVWVVAEAALCHYSK